MPDRAPARLVHICQCPRRALIPINTVLKDGEVVQALAKCTIPDVNVFVQVSMRHSLWEWPVGVPCSAIHKQLCDGVWFRPGDLTVRCFVQPLLHALLLVAHLDDPHVEQCLYKGSWDLPFFKDSPRNALTWSRFTMFQSKAAPSLFSLLQRAKRRAGNHFSSDSFLAPRPLKTSPTFFKEGPTGMSGWDGVYGHQRKLGLGKEGLRLEHIRPTECAVNILCNQMR